MLNEIVKFYMICGVDMSANTQESTRDDTGSQLRGTGNKTEKGDRSYNPRIRLWCMHNSLFLNPFSWMNIAEILQTWR